MTTSTLVQFPAISGTVKFVGTKSKNDIVGFFSPWATAPYDLRDYLKGAGSVENIASNSGVPSSGSIDMRDLLGAWATLSVSMPTTAGGFEGTDNDFQQNFNTGGNVFISKHANEWGEFSWDWSLTNTTNGVNLTIVTSSYDGSGFGSWKSFYIRVTKNSALGYHQVTGVLTLSIRSKADTSKVVTESTTVTIEIENGEA